MKKLKLKDGSVLVFSLIILFIGVVVALGIASTTVISKKMSGTTGKSTQSFQIADSGVEIVLKKVKDVVESNGGDSTIDDLNLGCQNGVVKGNIGSSKYEVEFYKEGEESPVSSCSTKLSDLEKMKSVGSYANTSRAIEAAVAAGDEYRGCIVCSINDTNWKSCTIKKGGENICEDGDGCVLSAVRYAFGAATGSFSAGSDSFFQHYVSSSGQHYWARGDSGAQKTNSGVYGGKNIWTIGNLQINSDSDAEDDADSISARMVAPNVNQKWDLIICDN